MSKQYIFGPVASRRLGVSLGIDLIRSRRCTLDCIYCEAGATTDLTCARTECVKIEKVKAELQEFLADAPLLDSITFSGVGEPTLNSGITELASWIKDNYPQYRLCLLTNGTLLNDPEVRKVLEFVDIAMPNFDASNDRELEIINRPADGISVASLADGIKAAAREYPGKLILELFVVPGVNDSDESIGRFADFIESFKGLRSVQLNSLDRPGVVEWIKPASGEILKRFIARLEKNVPVEAVGRFRYRSAALCTDIMPGAADCELMEFLQQCSAAAEEIASKLDCSLAQAEERAEKLVKAGRLCAEKVGSKTVYSTI